MDANRTELGIKEGWSSYEFQQDKNKSKDSPQIIIDSNNIKKVNVYIHLGQDYTRRRK